MFGDAFHNHRPPLPALRQRLRPQERPRRERRPKGQVTGLWPHVCLAASRRALRPEVQGPGGGYLPRPHGRFTARDDRAPGHEGSGTRPRTTHARPTRPPHETIAWFAQAPYMEYIEVSYPALVRDPAPVIARLTEFLGANRLLHVDKMRAAVDPSPHRKKSKLD